MTDDQNSTGTDPHSTHGQNQTFPGSNGGLSDDQVQMLNQPLVHAQGLSPEDEQFLNMLMEKIDKKEIDLYRPSTLLNVAVYEKLDETARGKADFDSVNLLTTIREIRKLWMSGQRNTYQIENLTHRIRITKERLEVIGGDIFII